jgi:glycerol-3-phosphate O-acyltransferase
VPTSIAYDQILELSEYVRQNQGDEKEAESFVFLLRQIRAARARKLGRIHVRFAEPISLREYLDRSGDDRLVVEKLAFQMSNEINAATPFTPAALACSVLLGAGKRALGEAEFTQQAALLVDYAHERGIALTSEVEAGAESALRCASEALAGTGVIEKYAGGVEPVYYVTERGRHAASYYRNTVIHFMLVRAIAELAARAAAEDADPMRDTRSWALRLRELLKFEFFFAERDAFLRELEREQLRLSKEASQYAAPLLAACPRILLDFIESYWVVAETVRTLRGAETAVARAVVLRRCHELGRQLLLQDRVQSPELLSNMNFGNALKLLENLGAAERDGERYRAGPAAKLDELVRDLERLIALARS